MQSCGTSLCHEGSAAAAQLDLITPGVESRLKDASSTMCNGWKLVTPGAAQPSLLYQKVVSTTPPCGVPMPVGGPALAAEQLQCLKSWIESLAGPIPPPMCETCGTTMCIDLTQDASHCGACASPCAPGQVCKNSVCEGCPGGQISCGGTCVDVQTSNANCGSCGNVCSSGQTCSQGACQCSSTTAVSFASAVEPILTANCGGGGCHIPIRGARAADGLDLGPGKAYSELVGVASTQCASTQLVEPGNPSGSYLLDKLLGVRICQVTAMPKGKPQLSQQDLDTIGVWICGGAKP